MIDNVIIKLIQTHQQQSEMFDLCDIKSLRHNSHNIVSLHILLHLNVTKKSLPELYIPSRSLPKLESPFKNSINSDLKASGLFSQVLTAIFPPHSASGRHESQQLLVTASVVGVC